MVERIPMVENTIREQDSALKYKTYRNSLIWSMVIFALNLSLIDYIPVSIMSMIAIA